MSIFDICFSQMMDRKIILESRASYDVEKEWIISFSRRISAL